MSYPVMSDFPIVPHEAVRIIGDSSMEIANRRVSFIASFIMPDYLNLPKSLEREDTKPKPRFR